MPSRRQIKRRARPPRQSCHARVFTGTAAAFQAYSACQSNQLWLILAAVVTVYIVLGVLYESVHPSDHDSCRHLPSAGRRCAFVVAVADRELDFSVIALIGIMLAARASSKRTRS